MSRRDRDSPGGLRSGELRGGAAGGGVPALDVVVEDGQEPRHDVVASQRLGLLAVDEDRRDGLLERAGKADPDVCVLRLARPVDDAAHDRDAQLLDARMRLTPPRHLLDEVSLDVAGHLLEERRGGPTTAWAR